MDELEEATQAALAASRALLGIVAASLEPVLGRVTVPQFRILALLYALGPTRTGELARRLGVHPSTFSRTGDRLVTAGLMRRTGNPENGREVLVQLTPAGKRLVRSVWQRRAAGLRRILEPLPAPQRRTILDGFTAFAAAAGEPALEEVVAVLGA